MSRHTKLALGLLPFLAVTAGAETGNRVCIGGNVEQLTSTQLHFCQQQAQQVRRAAEESGLANWHFVVVCNDEGWHDYAAFSNTSAETLEASATDTDVDTRTTFVRAARFSGPEFVTTQLASLALQVTGPQVESGD